MYVERKIRKVGNSLGITLPSDVLKFLGINEGDTLKVYSENDKIVLEIKKNP